MLSNFVNATNDATAMAKPQEKNVANCGVALLKSSRCQRQFRALPVIRASEPTNRARQLYKNISMLFLFPVKDVKLNTSVNATFNASCYG